MTMIDPNLKDQIGAQLVETSILQQLGLEAEDMHGIVVRASEKLATGDPVGAFSDYATLVLMDPTAVTFQIGLAEAAIMAGQSELGMQAAAIVIMETPDRPEGYYLSGRACLAMGERELAVEDFTQALAKCEGKSDLSDLAKGVRHFLSAAQAE